MNEQIRKLMIEAGKTIPGDKQIDADFCEKFAELLIDECTELLNTYGGAFLVYDLRQHFGVEE